jgi:hypothetical protein
MVPLISVSHYLQTGHSRDKFPPHRHHWPLPQLIPRAASTSDPLYPLIDQEEIWRIHGTATGEAMPAPISHTAADLARLHLIYAIGSRCIQLLKPRKIPKHLPEGHLMSAMQHIPEMLKVTSIHTVEVTLLLAIHSMRSPSGNSIPLRCRA